MIGRLRVNGHKQVVHGCRLFIGDTGGVCTSRLAERMSLESAADRPDLDGSTRLQQAFRSREEGSSRPRRRSHEDWLPGPDAADGQTL